MTPIRLTALKPRWVLKGGKRIGFIFLNPTGPARGSRQADWLLCLTVLLAEACNGDRFAFYDRLMDALDADPRRCMESRVLVGVKDDIAWAMTGDSFNNITIKPSIDASQSGNWHGFITDGNVT